MNVTIFGTGYVGLVQGAVLAEVGHNVLCIDVDTRKIDQLRNNIIPIYEPGLETLVRENQSIGRLRFGTDAAEGIDFNPKILKAVEERNAEQKTTLFQKIHQHFNGQLAGKTIALWGLAFKPNTDDMREAPSRVLMEALWQAGATVQAYDPEAMEEAQRIYGDRDDLILGGTKEAALKGADALAIVTEWQSFRVPDFDLIFNKLTEPTIFDGRNLFEPARMQRKGFVYYSVGRQITTREGSLQRS